MCFPSNHTSASNRDESEIIFLLQNTSYLILNKNKTYTTHTVSTMSYSIFKKSIGLKDSTLSLNVTSKTEQQDNL